MLDQFLGKGKSVKLDDFTTYHKAGKSFNITINSHDEARETVAAWKEMHVLDYISRPTIISWIAEGLLMKEDIRISQRIMVCEVMLELFDRTFMEDCAAYLLLRSRKQTQTKSR
jgi:hypothetical protein